MARSHQEPVASLLSLLHRDQIRGSQGGLDVAGLRKVVVASVSKARNKDRQQTVGRDWRGKAHHGCHQGAIGPTDLSLLLIFPGPGLFIEALTLT